jgi:hypothetical protein
MTLILELAATEGFTRQSARLFGIELTRFVPPMLDRVSTI